MLNIRRAKNEKSLDYHTDLETQAHERAQQRKKSAEEQRIKSVEVHVSLHYAWFMGLHSSDGRALQRERRGHGFDRPLAVVLLSSEPRAASENVYNYGRSSRLRRT